MTSLTDTLMASCALSRWDGDGKRCRWCNAALRYPRRSWCSDTCAAEFPRHHVWASARDAALARDRFTCTDCPPGPDSRVARRRLEVHHQEPCAGQRGAGCVHHLDNLVTFCQPCHRARHQAGTHPGQSGAAGFAISTEAA